MRNGPRPLANHALIGYGKADLKDSPRIAIRPGCPKLMKSLTLPSSAVRLGNSHFFKRH